MAQNLLESIGSPTIEDLLSFLVMYLGSLPTAAATPQRQTHSCDYLTPNESVGPYQDRFRSIRVEILI